VSPCPGPAPRSLPSCATHPRSHTIAVEKRPLHVLAMRPWAGFPSSAGFSFPLVMFFFARSIPHLFTLLRVVPLCPHII
jgi:hypothetical protein